MIRASIIALFFFSCTSKTKVPHNILPPYKMEKVLLDMLRADEFFNQKQIDSATRDSFNRTNLYQSVFALHKTNKQAFKRSFTYYESHPDLLKIILDSMYSEANKKLEAKNTVQTDSILKKNLNRKFFKKNKRDLAK
jgi:hypothetical protein